MGDKAPKFLTAEEVAGAADCREIVVDVPEWGGPVKMRELTAAGALDLDEKQAGATKTQAFFLQLAATIVDPVLTVEQLREKNQKVLVRLHGEVSRLQGWTNEGAAKNDSGEAAPASSPTA